MAESKRRVVPHFQRENLAVLRGERLQVLLAQHWSEVAHYKDIALEVDWAKYETAESANKLRIFTARHEHELIGYACFCVDFNPHYSSSFQAVQDVLFLTPEYRRAHIGAQLIAFSDTMLRSEGVAVSIHHSKVAHPIDALLLRQDYELVERILMKRLDRE